MLFSKQQKILTTHNLYIKFGDRGAVSLIALIDRADQHRYVISEGEDMITLADLRNVNQQDLKIVYRSAVYLRDRLHKIGRGGPLLKLLDQEIHLIHEEFERRTERAADARVTQEIKTLDVVELDD